jgi:hypothetical protein
MISRPAFTGGGADFDAATTGVEPEWPGRTATAMVMALTVTIRSSRLASARFRLWIIMF